MKVRSIQPRGHAARLRLPDTIFRGRQINPNWQRLIQCAFLVHSRSDSRVHACAESPWPDHARWCLGPVLSGYAQRRKWRSQFSSASPHADHRTLESCGRTNDGKALFHHHSQTFVFLFRPWLVFAQRVMSYSDFELTSGDFKAATLSDQWAWNGKSTSTFILDPSCCRSTG
jgi:hypothetical protein